MATIDVTALIKLARTLDIAIEDLIEVVEESRSNRSDRLLTKL
jgi:hypothetical protein